MTPTARKKPPHRKDRPGHIDPKRAASLLARGQETKSTDDDRAFVGVHANDDLASELGEEAVRAMTSGEDSLTDERAASHDEESGGPFTITSAASEFADGTDASNPKRATKEPFPKT